jgi:hypothetical protein
MYELSMDLSNNKQQSNKPKILYLFAAFYSVRIEETILATPVVKLQKSWR